MGEAPDRGGRCGAGGATLQKVKMLISFAQLRWAAPVFHGEKKAQELKEIA